MNRAVVALGSNIEPDVNIQKAKDLIKSNFQNVRESQFIFTDPIGVTDQDLFLNGSIYMETELAQGELVQTLKSYEDSLGRKRSPVKYGPRTIDLDLVVYNGMIVDNDFYERDFVKSAVLELWPDLNY